jgi:PTS system nitrogen regulatory IIA component
MLHLNADRIVLDMKATNKEGALQELVNVLHDQCPHIQVESLSSAVRERELIGSTGVGNGIAIPHGKLAELEQILYCFGRSREGIGFEAIDNQPVHYFFMILSPTGAAEEYLQTLAGASRLLKKTETRRRLRLATDKQEIIETFLQNSDKD